MEIFTKQEELVKIDVYKIEIQEAISAAEKVLLIIPKVSEDLEDAKLYANWDIVGGGAMITHWKREKMKDAKLGIVEINYVLNKLKRELNGLKPDLLPATVNFDTSWEFADYFFDNIFLGLEIREKIVDAYNSILSLRDSIILLKEKLIAEKNTQQNLYHEKESGFRKLIEQV